MVEKIDLSDNALVDGYILAGGTSQRMGTDKAALHLGGRTLVERAFEALAPIAATVSVVGNVSAERFGLPIICDIIEAGGKRGSIVGLVSALRHCKQNAAAVLACDLPFVTTGLMSRLVQVAVAESEVDCVVPVQPDGRLQPLCAIYRKSKVLKAAENCLDRGQWRLQQMLGGLSMRRVEFDEIEDLPGSSNFFFNVNTLAEFEEAAQITEEAERLK